MYMSTSMTLGSALRVAESNENASKKIDEAVIREIVDVASENASNRTKQQRYKMEIVWINVMIFVVLHAMALYGVYCYFTAAKYLTMIQFWIYGSMGGVGVTGGAHRLWSHRSYKATLTMRILLMMMQCVAHQNCIYDWVRDHRVHHKFTDTDADPHNSRRGFFFSHMGWLMVKKHPDVKKRGNGVDMSDVANDPVVAFQKKYFYFVMPWLCIVIPTLIPVYCWNENLKIAFFVTIFRYALSLHFTWLINSAAHAWGNKPYDKSISSTDNKIVAAITYGEAWHNYHHVFPWDYKAAELGNYSFNITTAFIDFFSWFGMTYDLKTVPTEMVRRRILKTGDGSWQDMDDKTIHDDDQVWGWNDKDMKEEDKLDAEISKRTKQKSH